MGCTTSNLGVWIGLRDSDYAIQRQLNQAYSASEAFERRFEENAKRMEALVACLEGGEFLGKQPPVADPSTTLLVMDSSNANYEAAKDVVLLNKAEFAAVHAAIYEAIPTIAPLRLSYQEWQKLLNHAKVYLGTSRSFQVYYRGEREKHQLLAVQQIRHALATNNGRSTVVTQAGPGHDDL